MSSRLSRRVRAACMNPARMPRERRLSTWSFISEISGVTTTVSPGSSMAGT